MDVEAVIDLLLTIGYVDGLLHEDEKKFIAQYLDRVIEHVAATPDERGRMRTRIDDAYARLDREIAARVTGAAYPGAARQHRPCESGAADWSEKG